MSVPVRLSLHVSAALQPPSAAVGSAWGQGGSEYVRPPDGDLETVKAVLPNLLGVGFVRPRP